MDQKSVSDLILEKFAENIKKDELSAGISEDLIALVSQKKHSKSDIKKMLRRERDEDSKSGS